MEEIVQHTGFSKDKVLLVLGAFQEPLPLDGKVQIDTETLLSDMIEDRSLPKPEQVVGKLILREQVCKLLRN